MKLQRWHYYLTTRQKMIIGFLSVSLFSVLLMALFSQMYYGKATKDDFFAISIDASSRLNHQMDFYLQQLIQSTSSLVAGPMSANTETDSTAPDLDLIQSWLRNDRDGGYTRLDISTIEDTLRRYVALNYSEIVNMFLISKDNSVISMYGSFLDNDANYRNEPWYYFSPEESHHVRVLPTHLTQYPQFTGVPVVSIVIPVYSTQDAGFIGRLVLDIKLRQIENILGRSTLGRSGFFFIVSADGTVVYHPDSENWGQPRQLTDLRLLDLSRTTSVQQWEGQKVLLAYSHSDFTDWDVAALVPYDEMASGLNIARKSTLVVVLIISLCIIFIVPLLSGTFVRPIRRLNALMQEVERGNLNARAEIHPGRDELLSLYASFNHMTGQLKQLMETVSDLRVNEVHIQLRQKEALIQALQNQINPHLLYNTLDIIKSLAYLEKVPKIELITRNLADVYRYTAKSPELEVTLREELEHLVKYLQIVHVRFPKHFQSRLYVNDKYAACPIVRLTLQPIVENAVKYAIEPQGGKGTIIVSAFHEDKVLIIEIADNGPGIPEERLNELQDRLAFIRQNMNDEFLRQESLGIANVHARLVLQYGEAFGVQVASFPERGAIISVRIPLRDFDGIG